MGLEFGLEPVSGLGLGIGLRLGLGLEHVRLEGADLDQVVDVEEDLGLGVGAEVGFRV